MLYKQKGSQNCWIKYYRNGRPIRGSTGTDKETEAKRILREKEGDIAAGPWSRTRIGRVSRNWPTIS